MSYCSCCASTKGVYHSLCSVCFDKSSSLSKQLEEKEIEISRLREQIDHLSHVIIESSEFPGGHVFCKCEACTAVARQMDDAGWCEHAKDRWWEESTCDAGKENTDNHAGD